MKSIKLFILVLSLIFVSVPTVTYAQMSMQEFIDNQQASINMIIDHVDFQAMGFSKDIAGVMEGNKDAVKSSIIDFTKQLTGYEKGLDYNVNDFFSLLENTQVNSADFNGLSLYDVIKAGANLNKDLLTNKNIISQFLSEFNNILLSKDIAQSTSAGSSTGAIMLLGVIGGFIVPSVLQFIISVGAFILSAIANVIIIPIAIPVFIISIILSLINWALTAIMGLITGAVSITVIANIITIPITVLLGILSSITSIVAVISGLISSVLVVSIPAMFISPITAILSPLTGIIGAVVGGVGTLTLSGQ